MFGVAYTNEMTSEVTVHAFVTSLYVKIDDELLTNYSLRIWRPEAGIALKWNVAGLLPMAVLQALLGFTSETLILRYAHENPRGFFPYRPTPRSLVSR